MAKLKGKQKGMVLFIRIEVHYWILSDKCQTKIFPILRCTISYTNFLGSEQYLWNLISIKAKGGPSVILSK